MATDILIKRSTTPGAVPTTGDLSTGELAINTADKRLFTNNSGTIVEIGTAPTSLAVTNNATVGGTLGVTGTTTLTTVSTSGAATLASGSVTGNFSVAGTLTVATPSNSTDAASKGYVDTAVANVIDSAPGALDTLNELAAAINDDANFATTITNALAGKLALAGGTMTGDITLGANKITSTATPATADTLTRKGYVDSILGSATDAATSATAAASSATDAANSASAASTSASNASTSATNAATSATNASTSETNAATSASSASSSATASANSATAAATSASNAATSEANAAASYDSFDDRYLGAKASDPSVDNDGDALLTGALYFNTGNNTMRVYNGSAWEDVVDAVINLADDTTPQLGGNLDTNGNDINFGDNDKAIFGAGSDLQIYHNSSNNRSFIAENGASDLYIQANDLRLVNSDSSAFYAYFVNGGSASLYHNNSAKLATTATGIDVTGTVVAGTNGNIQLYDANLRADSNLYIGTTNASDGALQLYTDDKNRMLLASNGDISFYEDTGTTPKLFWDASAESLGIGTASPQVTTHIQKSAVSGADYDANDILTLENNGYNAINIIASPSLASSLVFSDDERARGSVAYDHSSNSMAFRTVATERMRINSSGNVGIGTSNPSAGQLVLTKSSNGGFGGSLVLENSNASDTDKVIIAMRPNGSATTAAGSYGENRIISEYNSGSTNGASNMQFWTHAGVGTVAERMRIDSSGNLLVGTTATSTEDEGFRYRADLSAIASVADGGTSGYFGRLNSDGLILRFRRDSTTVGSIGAFAGHLSLGNTDTGLLFNDTIKSIYPLNLSTLSNNDNAIDLGFSSSRFDDIYATNGTIQTSDRNEKQDIEELSEAEQRVAVACKGLMRKFRWKSAVEEKGDDARIHFGIIAQDLQAAFEAEGLDAGRYAMFISSTWWETQTEVPAVAEEVDEDGNVITEAQEAYTRTDTYDTAEEAPEGAVERTRLGVRYPELLAFIISAI